MNFTYKISFCNEQSFLLLIFCQLSETYSSNHVIYFPHILYRFAQQPLFSQQEQPTAHKYRRSFEELPPTSRFGPLGEGFPCVFVLAKINCIRAGCLRTLSWPENERFYQFAPAGTKQKRLCICKMVWRERVFGGCERVSQASACPRSI